MNEVVFNWNEQTITGYIYFMEYQEGGPIKIGYAKNIDERLHNLQVACPYELRVLASVPGSVECEKHLHRYFDFCSMRGEWFWPAYKLQKFIRMAKKFDRDNRHLTEPVLACIKNKTSLSMEDIYGPNGFATWYQTIGEIRQQQMEGASCQA